LFIIVKGNLCLPSKAQIAHEILAYLAEHPDAQDTLDGIVQWWLLERKIEYQRDLVIEALAQLTAKGFIEERPGANQRRLYVLSRQRMNEIIAFLQ